jgi:hypothetical protein
MERDHGLAYGDGFIHNGCWDVTEREEDGNVNEEVSTMGENSPTFKVIGRRN